MSGLGHGRNISGAGTRLLCQRSNVSAEFVHVIIHVLAVSDTHWLNGIAGHTGQTCGAEDWPSDPSSTVRFIL